MRGYSVGYRLLAEIISKLARTSAMETSERIFMFSIESDIGKRVLIFFLRIEEC